MMRVYPLNVSVEMQSDGRGGYAGHDVYLNNVLIDHRPYDGSLPDEVIHEVYVALADLLREALGWSETPPDNPFPDVYEDPTPIPRSPGDQR